MMTQLITASSRQVFFRVEGPYHTSPQGRTELNRLLGVLYGNGAFYSLTARCAGSYVTIPVQIPKSAFYSVRPCGLVWYGRQHLRNMVGLLRMR